MCSLMVANATKPHPIFPRGVWQQLLWLDHNFKIKLPDTIIRLGVRVRVGMAWVRIPPLPPSSESMKVAVARLT